MSVDAECGERLIESISNDPSGFCADRRAAVKATLLEPAKLFAQASGGPRIRFAINGTGIRGSNFPRRIDL
jgi:hypothetical protein